MFTNNTGYLGLPLVIELFDGESVVTDIFIITGMNLYEYSYGFYLNLFRQIQFKI
ncbi:MAG: hypothetical protein ABI045_00700 [Flavobacteriales bacterium]